MSLVLLAAVLLVFLGSSVVYEEAESYIVDDARTSQLAEALMSDARVLAAAPVGQRPVLAVMLSTDDLALTWRAEGSAPRKVRLRQAAGLDELRLGMIHTENALGHARLVLGVPVASPSDVSGEIMLPDGSWLDFTAPSMVGRHHVTRGLASAAITAGAVSLAAAMLVRALSTPLRALSDLADGVASSPDDIGEQVHFSEQGPREVRGLARAINAMQARIHRLVEDRTEMLAAVSHDLRTPLQRLRLRAGFLNDPEAQAAIEADVAEMEAMVSGVLAYLAGDRDPEPLRQADLAAILATLVDERADRGCDVRYEGPDRCAMALRPLAMRRVFANLIDNALTYGGNAEVILTATPRGSQVSVTDDGPGIPDADLDRVTTPFFRLEGSRSRSTGGIGLGLAIVKRETERAGGTLELCRAEGRGLRAIVRLPYAADTAADDAASDRR
ncbi:ATP-binding protein [Tanticharoenia sakaeratensis]|uniref:histidine kinase n=1 Tax=Tanticharoenia sakaeratensis NBRC 103193 TaxID=1231623 RepID=A0A0D6MGT2_9PROT|nr:ATP-binding protein [Tanticharoenia sakaeratensis]GAN52817.1 osmolarity sensor protein envZ [Tanticharoenia sakaeratensis NBRC 103193]GBQ18103.1 two component sensor histidine kinase [Tanticharoenia sakaeratensis NBRC 103193]